MITTLDLRGSRRGRAELARLVPRPQIDPSTVTDVAAALIEEVRQNGESALIAQSERFDGVRPDSVRLDPGFIIDAVRALPPAVREALEESIDRVRQASYTQLPAPEVTQYGHGAQVVQRWQPVDRVGLYVPGGKAVYPSSVVMNVVPAQVAGVASIALASPAQSGFRGSVHPLILGAAGLLGVDEVYAMGGAGAMAAFAYGVPSINLDPVDLVTGPGNVFVATAKRLLQGVVGIDSEAGPTEILIIADGKARPAFIASDLISQAEHDELAAAVLVTDSPELATAVEAELERLVPSTKHADRVRIALGATQSAIVLVDDLAAAAAFSNAYGPEHLEIQTKVPGEVLDLVTNAGAIFLGEYAPVSLGDYLAGSNHVLPTGGRSRSSAGLSVTTFLRSQQVIQYERVGLEEVAPYIRALSDAEDLPGHGDAVDIRFGN